MSERTINYSYTPQRVSYLLRGAHDAPEGNYSASLWHRKARR